MKVSQVGCFPLFWISHLQCFSRHFCQNVHKETILFELTFQKSFLRCSLLQRIRMSNFVILKWRPYEYKVKSPQFWEFLWLLLRNKKCWHFEFFMNQLFQQRFLISHKITYMVLLLLKLRAVGLDYKLVYILGKTVQDMVLESYFRQIASSQGTSFWCF